MTRIFEECGAMTRIFEEYCRAAAVIGPTAELDAAIDVLAWPSSHWIIKIVIGPDCAVFLRLLRRTNGILTRSELKTWKHQFAEARKRRAVFYESKKPIKIGINRDRVIAMAAETNRRLDRWALVENGDAYWEVTESGRRRFVDCHQEVA
jgi:hypothetical protein